MDRLDERLTAARRALATLEEIVDKGSVSTIERDAAIQRFEYTVEAIWKAARTYLRDREGIEHVSPKAVVRGCLHVGLFGRDDCRAGLAMIDDRNLTAHTYNEELATAIFARLNGYARLMDRWLAAMETQ